ncbi:MAG TPA: hypothetical protein VF334_06965 [Polyangia bacterium]
MSAMKAMLSAVTLSAMLALPAMAHAQVKVPETAADHLALAKSYQDKAALYKKEVAEHQAMAEAYKKSIAPGSKATGENPWAKKMEAHCRAIAADAQRLATDAEKAAEYHTLRARELQGK